MIKVPTHRLERVSQLIMVVRQHPARQQPGSDGLAVAGPATLPIMINAGSAASSSTVNGSTW
jgi:hypothetical protein